MLLTDEQQALLLVYAPCALASLSAVGSGMTLLTLFQAWRSSKQNQKHAVNHRLLSGISVLDLLTSLAWSLGPWPIPREEEDLGENTSFTGIQGHGTLRTCSLQGFLFQLGSGCAFYNTGLLFYYVLIVVFGCKDDWIRWCIEPFLHAWPLGFSLVTAIVGLAMDVYNPLETCCWIADQPLGCSQDPSMDCERGSAAGFFYIWFFLVPQTASTLFLILFSVTLVSTVWWRFVQKQPQLAFESGLIIWQVLLYGATMTNCAVWSFLASLIAIQGDAQTSRDFFWMAALVQFFCPLQGLFNFIIFIRPRYLSIRNRLGLSPWWCLMEAVWYPTDTLAARRERHQIGQAPSECSFGSRLNSENHDADHHHDLYYDDRQTSGSHSLAEPHTSSTTESRQEIELSPAAEALPPPDTTSVGDGQEEHPVTNNPFGVGGQEELSELCSVLLESPRP